MPRFRGRCRHKYMKTIRAAQPNSCKKSPPPEGWGVDDRVIRGEGEGKCRFEADGLLHVLQGVVAFLAGADLDDVLHIVHENLAVADMAGV